MLACCALVGSSLDYASSVLTNISSRNVHRLQRVQNSLAQVVTHSTTNSTSAFNSLYWLPIRKRIDYYWLLLFTIHSIMPALNICLLHYRPTPQHVSFALPPSIFSSYLVSTSLLHLVVFGMLALLFGSVNRSKMRWEGTPTSS